MVLYDPIVLEGYTDHMFLYTFLRVEVQPPLPAATATTPAATTPAATTFCWDVGATTEEQQRGIQRWRDYTATEAFREGMARIVQDRGMSNEDKSAAMETYLIESGEEAGVVSVRRVKPPLNPNRWGKHLAPWFDSACRECKQ